jgi:YD repeat-containing protein
MAGPAAATPGAAGQVTQVKTALGTAEEANEVTVTYRNNGKAQTVTDVENNKTTYVYDGHDRLSQTQFPSATKGAGTSNSSDYEQPSYDANGNVTSLRNRAGETASFTFDALKEALRPPCRCPLPQPCRSAAGGAAIVGTRNSWPARELNRERYDWSE